jgi:type IV pilus assembly protein PilW
MKMTKQFISNQSLRCGQQRGFSLVEIMVGLVLGLLGTIVIFQVFAISEGQKRTTTSGNDANQNGIFALHTMERQLRMSGSGLVVAQGALGCLVNASYDGATKLLSGNVRATPLLIQDGGGSAPDKIITMYGNSALAGPTFDISNVFGETMHVTNTVGINQNDILLVVSGDQSDTNAPPLPCAIGQMTNASAEKESEIEMDPSKGKYNATGGITNPGLTENSTGINLGQGGLFGFAINNPVNTNRYELASYDFLTGTTASVADNIVNLQALYGIDNGGGTALAEDSIIDSWVPATGAWDYTALNDGSAVATKKLRRIKAVRIALVARSALPEKPDASGNPITPAAWSLFATGLGAPAGKVSGTLSDEARNYRYKIFETVIPLRNMLLYQCPTNERNAKANCNPV